MAYCHQYTIQLWACRTRIAHWRLSPQQQRQRCLFQRHHCPCRHQHRPLAYGSIYNVYTLPQPSSSILIITRTWQRASGHSRTNTRWTFGIITRANRCALDPYTIWISYSWTMSSIWLKRKSIIMRIWISFCPHSSTTCSDNSWPSIRLETGSWSGITCANRFQLPTTIAWLIPMLQVAIKNICLRLMSFRIRCHATCATIRSNQLVWILFKLTYCGKIKLESTLKDESIFLGNFKCFSNFFKRQNFNLTPNLSQNWRLKRLKCEKKIGLSKVFWSKSLISIVSLIFPLKIIAQNQSTQVKLSFATYFKWYVMWAWFCLGIRCKNCLYNAHEKCSDHISVGCCRPNCDPTIDLKSLNLISLNTNSRLSFSSSTKMNSDIGSACSEFLFCFVFHLITLRIVISPAQSQSSSIFTIFNIFFSCHTRRFIWFVIRF